MIRCSFAFFSVVIATAVPLSAQDPIEVDAVSVVTGPWPAAVRMTSTVEPIDMVWLRPTCSSVVQEVAADVGDSVEAGQVLAVLHRAAFEVGLAEARAALELARTGLELAKHDAASEGLAVRAAEVEVQRVRAERDSIKQQQEVAIEELDRSKALHEAGTLGIQEVQRARVRLAEVQTAGREFASRIDAAEVDLERVRRGTETARMRIRAAEARVEAAQLAVDRATIALEACQIRAPFKGTVLERGVSVGDAVRAFESPMFRLVDLDRVRVRINVPRRRIGQTPLGAKVWIRRNPYALDAEESAITRLAMAVEKDSEGVLVREATVEFQNRDRRWLLGDECSVWLLPEEGDEPAYCVPATAVVERDGVAYVWLLNEKRGRNEVKLQRVILGRRDGEDVEILTGIGSTKYRIIDAPPEGLESGERVALR